MTTLKDKIFVIYLVLPPSYGKQKHPKLLITWLTTILPIEDECTRLKRRPESVKQQELFVALYCLEGNQLLIFHLTIKLSATTLTKLLISEKSYLQTNRNPVM